MMKRSGFHDARREHGIHVLRIGADGGHEAARPIDAELLQRLLAARIAFHGEMAALVGLGDFVRIAIDDDERRLLALELARDDRSDSPVPADDVMVLADG